MYQKNSITELGGVTSGEISISNYIEEAEKLIEGKEIGDAIFELGLIENYLKIPHYELKLKNLQRNIFCNTFFSVAINENGKIIGRHPSMLSDNKEEVEAAIKVEMYNHAQYHHLIHTQGLVEPTRRKIIIDHSVRLKDICYLVENNPFVPQGRKIIFAEGLLKGFYGDFLTSAHLLISQLENSIRHILYETGKIVFGIDSEGIQDEKNFNSLLFIQDFEEAYL